MRAYFFDVHYLGIEELFGLRNAKSLVGIDAQAELFVVEAHRLVLIPEVLELVGVDLRVLFLLLLFPFFLQVLLIVELLCLFHHSLSAVDTSCLVVGDKHKLNK